PFAYLFAAIALSFTALSYAQMVKAFPISGSAYTYVQKAFNSKAGFLVGWALLTDYMLLPMVNYLIASIFLSSVFPSIPAMVWILILVVCNTFINIRGTKMASWVNSLLLAYAFIVVILFTIFSIRFLQNDGESLWSTMPFVNSGFDLGLLMAGASLLCFSYLGFDSVTTLAEEVVNPKKTIPRAIFTIVLIGTAVFVVVSYFAARVQPNYQNFSNLDASGMELVAMVGGNLFVSLFLAGMLIGCFASGLAAQSSASRVLYAMGRDGMLPAIFSKLHAKYQTPVFNLVLVGLSSLLSIVMTLTMATAFINFGAMIAFLFVNLSVIGFYYVKQKKRDVKGTILYLILPSCGALFVLYLIISLNVYSLILGITWGAIGVCYLIYLVKVKGMKKLDLSFEEAS
ncbi:MAG: APC family permease, partial [Kurthia sp.]|nr:APC family permease [Kurthia sp.]